MIRRPRSNRRSAFTLLEILLVMAILVLMAGIAIPTLQGMYADARLKGAADQVRGAWSEARARAIEDGLAYRFGVQPGTGKFRVSPDSNNSATDFSADSAPYSVEESLPNGIVFEVNGDLPSDGEYSTVAIFNPNGTCDADIEITLTDDDESTSALVVRVRAMTGAISVAVKGKGR